MGLGSRAPPCSTPLPHQSPQVAAIVKIDRPTKMNTLGLISRRLITLAPVASRYAESSSPGPASMAVVDDVGAALLVVAIPMKASRA